MLNFWGRNSSLCDRINRREFLRVGGLGAAGLSLADVLRLQAQSPAPKKHKAVIQVILRGGVSHIDTWDMKPNAPADIRGEFKPIQTNVPGFDVCELLALHARMADKMSLVRSVVSVDDDHAMNEVYSGFSKRVVRPAFGGVVSSQVSADGDTLPRYVSLCDGDLSTYELPRYAGAAHKAFRPDAEGLNNLRLRGVNVGRLEERKQLLGAFDTLRRDLDASGEAAGMDKFTARALEIITSDKARDAFDLGKEPDKVRARYRNSMYQYFEDQRFFNADNFLLARRLVEAGVSVVTLTAATWDHHQIVFPSYRTLLPLLDRTLYALTTDLYERGLDKDVLVVVFGEFGRTPRVNKDGGRDHYAPAGSALFIGGGLKMGQVIGETDSKGTMPKSRPYSYQNLLATQYHALGIDVEKTILRDYDGRPMTLLDDREPIRELTE